MNIARIQPLRSFTVNGRVTDIAWSPNGEIFAIAVDDNILLYDAKTLKVSRILKGHRLGVWTLDFSSDGQMLVSGGGLFTNDHSVDNTVRIWDVETGNLLTEIPHPSNERIVKNVVFTSNDRVVMTVTNYYRKIRLWDTVIGKLIKEFEIHPMDLSVSIVSDEFSSDGQYFGIGHLYEGFQIWRIFPKPKLLSKLSTFGYGPNLVFTEDEQRYAITSQANMTLIQSLDHPEIRLENYYQQAIFDAIAFNPTGELLVESYEFPGSCYQGVRLRFLDTTEGNEFHNFQVNRNSCITLLSFNPAGTLLVSIDDNGKVIFWGVATICFPTYRALCE